VILERLSPRQRDCLRLVFERRTSKEIAAELGIGIGTVDSYIAEAVALLGAQNRRRAAEMLFGDLQPAPPEHLEPENTGVASPPPDPSLPETAPQPRNWLGVLPFRTSGVEPHDLKPSRRLFWILQIAFGLAISFGMFVTGLDVISRLLGIP
jgi:DNA-binding CsgD family transcriptional regulator